MRGGPAHRNQSPETSRSCTACSGIAVIRDDRLKLRRRQAERCKPFGVAAEQAFVELGNSRCALHESEIPVRLKGPELGSPQVAEVAARFIVDGEPKDFGVGWKQMPSDLSSPRLGERSLKLIDDISNWGDHKTLMGEVDILQIDPTHELYAHMNLTYVRLPKLPPPKSSLGSDVLIAHLRSYPEAQRTRLTMNAAMADLLRKSFPCPSRAR